MICSAIIRIYISDRVKLDYFLSGFYITNIINFIFVAIALFFNAGSRNERFLIALMTVIGVIAFIWAEIVSIKNIRRQYINTNKFILFLVNIICIITVIPAILIATIIPLIDLGIFIKHIKSLGYYRKVAK